MPIDFSNITQKTGVVDGALGELTQGGLGQKRKPDPTRHGQYAHHQSNQRCLSFRIQCNKSTAYREQYTENAQRLGEMFQNRS